MESADTIIANVISGSGQSSGQNAGQSLGQGTEKFHARQLPTRANAVQQEIERQIIASKIEDQQLNKTLQNFKAKATGEKNECCTAIIEEVKNWLREVKTWK